MTKHLVEEFVVPKCSGKAFRVKKGQFLRVVEHEGKQTASLMFFNARNYKEQFMAEFSGGLSYFQPPALGEIGSHYRLGELYSKVPYENIMLVVTDNPLGDHFLGTHCTKTTMTILGSPQHRSCSDNFSDALAEFGLQLKDVYSPSVLNAFANIRIDTQGDGAVQIQPPRSKLNDFIELQAKMDVLAAVSACPDDLSPINDYSCKAIRIQIFDPA